MSLEVQAEAAHARAASARTNAEQWEAEAKVREAKARARIATIDLVERLLDSGVQETDFRRWDELLDGADTDVATLVNGVERYGSTEKLCQERRSVSENLKSMNVRGGWAEGFAGRAGERSGGYSGHA